MNKKAGYHLLSFLLIGVVIYAYFFKWKNGSFHDDDLYVLKSYSEAKGFLGKVNMATSSGIFRPFQGLSIYILIETLHKNFALYYIYNVLFQTINTLLLARIIDLFLKSPYLSLLVSLTLGLSRYCYYNIVQLYGGGALEGLATMFFLLCLFFVLKTLNKENTTDSQKQKGLLYSILYANFCMYTHERYVVLLPFIIFILLFFPSLRSLSLKTRSLLLAVAVFSITLPLLIKKYIFSMQLFMGTGYTAITFSFSSITSFLINSVKSLFQINTGPEYLSGIPYASLSPTLQLLVKILVAGMLFVLIRYVIKALAVLKIKHLASIRIMESKIRKAFVAKGQNFQNKLYTFIFLLILFFMLLAPAIIQIRIELRWLQASLSVLIIMIIIAFSELRFRNNALKSVLLISFTGLFLLSDFHYLNEGAKNLYFSTSGRIGAAFDDAIKKNIIRKNNTKLYIWEKDRVPDREGEINWALAYGYFFTQYQDKSIQLIYADSLYQKVDSGFAYTFPNFNQDTEQILSLRILNDGQTFQYFITDITNEYLKDSLKTFIRNQK